jgi:CRISPR-associated protein Csb3
MAEADIPVDIFNPAQVFGCQGFLEIGEVLFGNAAGAFDWENEADVRFRMRADCGGNPFKTILSFVRSENTMVEWLSPDINIKARDGGTTVVLDHISASPEPKAPDLPARLRGIFEGKERTIYFGFWADGSKRYHTTFKKSTNGASSHIRFMNAMSAIRALDIEQSAQKPFTQACRTKSLFRLDPRGSVDPIDAGTSPDKLRKGNIDLRMATYPISELLAVIGLEHARPEALKSNCFRYDVWGGGKLADEANCFLLPPLLARAAIGGELSFFVKRRFLVRHEEVKKGGDRKITSIIEEVLR